MNKDKSQQLIERLIHRVQTNTTDETTGSMNEPASVFLDDKRWQLEREKLFFETPQVIGFAGEVAEANSYITAESMGVPIVVTRDSDGELRAFINACAHRGAQVATGCGTKKRLTCGFHGWSYNLDGKLAGRPNDLSFSLAKDKCSLVSLPVSDRSGLIVVGLRSEMEPEKIDHALDDIADEFSGFGLDTVHTLESRCFDVKANWKLVVSLSHESYHFNVLHRDSLTPMMTPHAVIDEFGLHTRWSFPLRGIEKLADKPRSEWPLRIPGAISHTIFPGTVVIVNPSDAQIIRVEPGRTVDTSVVHFTGVYDDPLRKEESQQAFNFGGEIFETEDLPIAEQCQKGLSGGLQSIVIGSNEPIVQMWHQRWSQALES